MRRKDIHNALFRALSNSKVTTRGRVGAKWKGIKWNFNSQPNAHPKQPCRLCGSKFTLRKAPLNQHLNFVHNSLLYSRMHTEAGWCSYCEGIVVLPPAQPPYPGHNYRTPRRSVRWHADNFSLGMLPLDPVPDNWPDWVDASQ